MSAKSIRNIAVLLGVAILAVLIAHWHSMDAVLPGLLYLMAADVLCIACVFVAASAIMHDPGAKEAIEMSCLEVRARTLLLIAAQIVTIGIMNISSTTWRQSYIHLLTDYLLAGVFFVSTYRFISIADSPRQPGGYVPFSFFGYPRSRRFLFFVFAGYCTICPLALASLEFSIGSNGWRPAAFQASEACLLMATIMSLMCAAFVFQRYRLVKVSTSGLRTRVFIVAALFVGCAGAIQKIFSYSVYVYVLSALAIGGSVVAGISVWQIGDGHIQKELISSGSSSASPQRL